jgi:hypothetical protein
VSPPQDDDAAAAPADARRRLAEELARTLATEEGLRQARLLQALDLALPASAPAGTAPGSAAPATPRVAAALPAPAQAALQAAREAAARALRPKAPPAPLPIGPWKPQTRDGRLAFVRADPPGLGDPWPPHEELPLKRADGPRRVVFLGESAAAGWFYAPHLTPALVLERQLAAVAGPGAWEVVNLAKVDLSAPELMGLCGSVHQLQPDVIVLFAGNNWPQTYRVPPPGVPGPAEAALAFRQDGLRGLQRSAHAASTRVAEDVLGRLARLAAEATVRVVLVVPEVNLADFDRSVPTPWLPAGEAAGWYAAAAEARGRLDEGDFAGAETAARRMIALDGGAGAAAHRLLSRALEAQGRLDEAAAAARDEVDARAWDNHPFVPAVTSHIQRVLRERGAAHGFHLVDLPVLFAAHGGTPLPGRRYFLDYCHLTPEGMAVSMAAVAEQVLEAAGSAARPSWPDVLSAAEPPAVSAEREGRARFMAGLYTRHWTATDQPAPAFEYWIAAALEACDTVAEAMRGYLATRGVPAAALLFSERQQRLFASLDRSERHIWSAPHLDPEAVRALCGALEGRGQAVRAEVQDALVRHHAVRGRAVDLLRSVYHWGLTDQPRANSSLRHNPPAFYPARWPRSHFCLVAEGGRAVRLDLTARLPVIEQARAGELQLSVEGRPAGRVALEGGWRRHRLELPADLLRHGINRLTLEWPPLPEEGDAALARVGRRLDQRVGVDLQPVFGELMALRAVSG